MFSWESLYTVQVGGLAVAVTMLAEELAKKGHEVSYFTRSAEGQPEYMRIHGVDYHAFPMAPEPSSYALALGMSRTMAARLRHVEALRGPFDMIHGHDWLVVDALQDLKNEGRSIVMTYHSTAYGRNGGMAGDWPGFREISDRERYAGIIADRVTTVSNSMKAELNRLYGIPPDKIGAVIGPGGKIIRALQEETQTQIDIEDDGTVAILGPDDAAIAGARERIEALTATPEVGKIYDGKVVSLKDFGAFVEILPGQDGLLHISELSREYVRNVSDVVKEGDEVRVKIIAIDDQGRIKLSRKAVLEQEGRDARQKV